MINHAHLGAQIEAALGDGRQFGAQICYSAETEALKPPAASPKALPQLGHAPFLVVNGDVFTDYDFSRRCRCCRQWRPTPPGARPPAADRQPAAPPHWRLLPRSRANRRIRPPPLHLQRYRLLPPDFFAGVARGGKEKLANLLRPAIPLGRVSGEHFSGLWIDVGTPERLQHASDAASQLAP